jgi:hypothetical protein
MSYVFGDYKPVMGVPVGGMDPYDPVTNPYGLQQVESQPPPPPIQMQGAGLPSLGDPGPYGFTPQPTGGPEQLAGLMAMQQAQFGPILAGPPATDTGTGTGTGTDTTEETIVEPDDVEDPPTTPVDVIEPVYTDPNLDPYYDQEAIQSLINDYINNNSQNIIQDWMRNNPQGIGSLDLGQYGIYDDYYTQNDIDELLKDYTDNRDLLPADYSNYMLNTDVDKLLENYTLTSDIPPVDYSGYYDQDYIDNLLQGINGLPTFNPGVRMPRFVQE